MTAPVEEFERLLSIDEVAEILGVPLTTVRAWRARREGPRFVRVGKYLRCDPADLRAFIDELKAAS